MAGIFFKELRFLVLKVSFICLRILLTCFLFCRFVKITFTLRFPPPLLFSVLRWSLIMFILAFYFTKWTLCRQTSSIKSPRRIDKERNLEKIFMSQTRRGKKCKATRIWIPFRAFFHFRSSAQIAENRLKLLSFFSLLSFQSELFFSPFSSLR